MNEQKIEYRDARGLTDVVVAKLLTDDSESLTFDTPRPLFGAATLSKQTTVNSATKYYDNIAAIVISSEGADDFTLNGSRISDETLAYILGKNYHEDLGAYSDSEGIAPYCAIGYKSMDTLGREYYTWRYKGRFSVPNEDERTLDDGTDSNGTELKYTGINPVHKFTKDGDKHSKGIRVLATNPKVKLETFFTTVTTIDDLTPTQTPGA